MLPDAAVVSLAGIGPVLEASIDAPVLMRPNRKYTVWFHYANKGDADLYAPLFTVTCPNALFRLHADAPWEEGRIQFLGLNAEPPVQVLPPGAAAAYRSIFRREALRAKPLSSNTCNSNTTRASWIGATTATYCALPVGRRVNGGQLGTGGILPGMTWNGYFDALYYEAERLMRWICRQAGWELLQAGRRASGLPVARIRGKSVRRNNGSFPPRCGRQAQTTDDTLFILLTPRIRERSCWRTWRTANTACLLRTMRSVPP